MKGGLTMIANKMTLREHNETLVLSTIIHNPEISRAAISQLTGLNKASTSEIVKKFIDEQLINEIGIGNSTASGGRKPIQLQMNYDVGCSLSIDIGYDYIYGLLTNLNGERIHYIANEGNRLTKENTVSEINKIVTAMQPYYEHTKFQLIGITIAIHGIVYNNNIIFTTYSDLHEINLAEIIETKWNTPVYIENEANLSVLGEKGFTTPLKNMVSVSIHNGIGAGILIDGELYHGTKGQGGEIGHMILQPHGRPCPCGNKGCMEQYCSAAVLLKDYRVLTDSPAATYNDMSESYSNGETAVLELVHTAVDYLAFGINNLIMNLDPEVIILNSKLFDYLPTLLDAIKQRITNRFSKDVQIVESSLNHQAILLGGTILNLQHFFNIPDLTLHQKTYIEN